MIATSHQYIVKTPNICSGFARIEGTRVGVHDVVAMIQTGASINEVVASLPHITRAQVYACLSYYEDHKDEITPLVEDALSSPVDFAAVPDIMQIHTAER